MSSNINSILITNWFETFKIALQCPEYSMPWKTVSKYGCFISMFHLNLCIKTASKQLQSSNPKSSTASDLQHNITIGSLDQVETDSMKGENKNTSVCKIFTLATKYNQILYITVNMSSSHLNIVFQASDFTSHDNSNSFSNHSNKSQNTFCVKHEHNQPIYKSSACCFL